MFEFIALFAFNLIVLGAIKVRQDKRLDSYIAQLNQTSDTTNKIASIITEAEPALLDKISKQTKQLTQKTNNITSSSSSKMTDAEFQDLARHCASNGFQNFTVASIKLQMARLTYKQFSYLAATCSGSNTQKLFKEWEDFHTYRATDPRL